MSRERPYRTEAIVIRRRVRRSQPGSRHRLGRFRRQRRRWQWRVRLLLGSGEAAAAPEAEHPNAEAYEQRERAERSDERDG